MDVHLGLPMGPRMEGLQLAVLGLKTKSNTLMAHVAGDSLPSLNMSPPHVPNKASAQIVGHVTSVSNIPLSLKKWKRKAREQANLPTKKQSEDKRGRSREQGDQVMLLKL